MSIVLFLSGLLLRPVCHAAHAGEEEVEKVSLCSQEQVLYNL